MAELAALHPVSRLHLDALTGPLGIMQHAIGSNPDPDHGYCTDDVARALQVDLLHERTLGRAAIEASADRSLRFLADAFDPSTARFRNFRAMDGSWLEGAASEDSQGRAMLALGEVIAMSGDRASVDRAAILFHAALPAAQGVSAMRARASVLLGCDAAMRGAPTSQIAGIYRLLAGRLRATFQPRGSASAWPWPESRLTYENALPVRALIVAGHSLDSQPTLDLGLGLLDWLVAEQTAPDGRLSPIGNGWWPCGGVKSRFDQQPIEATALILAAASAYEITANERYRRMMEQAYGWFLGQNDVGVAVADPARGAGYDGLTPAGVNLNQGAESTLMWLMALERIRVLREERDLARPDAWTPPPDQVVASASAASAASAASPAG